MIVLDTSALLFYLFEPEKLTSNAIRAITQAETFIISSISIWEIGLKIKKGKLNIPLSVNEMLRILDEAQEPEIHPVCTETWLGNIALDWRHQDPADRTIVATAKLLGRPLVTSDRVIRAFYPQTIW